MLKHYAGSEWDPLLKLFGLDLQIPHKFLMNITKCLPESPVFLFKHFYPASRLIGNFLIILQEERLHLARAYWTSDILLPVARECIFSAVTNSGSAPIAGL